MAPGAAPMRVESVNIGVARPLGVGSRSVPSAIGKRAVAGRVGVGRLGLNGDEQADLTVHGGVAKAVYAYPAEHYAFWQTVRAQARVSLREEETLPPGFIGENLTLRGLRETDAYVGDRLRFADCELAVSKPRFPCHKFAAVMGFAQAPKMMWQSAWCGFYLSVLVPGSIGAGDAFELVPGPREVGIAELFRARAPG
jgi:MOSC domain-containing protein YiiM